VGTNGAYTPLASFDNNTGYPPLGSLASGNDGFLYGVADNGGTNNCGTIFRVSTDGTLNVLLSFNRTNGAYPRSGLVLGNDGCFYGTTDAGIPGSFGTVFRFGPNGELTTLNNLGISNGTTIYGRLTQGNDGWFYGITAKGGAGDGGTAFRMKPDGTWDTLFTFNNTNRYHTNICSSITGVVFGSDGNLYGTAPGGINGAGVIYRLNLPHIRVQPGVQFSPTEGFAFSVDGLTGHGPVILQASSDLLNWLSLLTNPPVTGTLLLQDVAATNHAFQFYRVLQQ
jgi:uncharacterized repeat protein (TIGR03803 family)